MNSSSPNPIPTSLSSLAYLESLSLPDQGLFLLSRLELVFPFGISFPKADLSWWSEDRLDPFGIAPGLPEDEIRSAIHLLLGDPWRYLVHADYVARMPEEAGVYQVTHEGRVVVKRNRVKVDIDIELPF
jgi:hypothetical protein